MQSLVGMWKMVRVRAFDYVGRDQVPPLGTHPMGIEDLRGLANAGGPEVTGATRC